MSSFWHPLSTILLSEPRCFATKNLLQMFLISQGGIDVIYAGDRMWPAIAHGAKVAIRPLEHEPRPGDVVLACPDGIPDLRRVTEVSANEILLSADADTEASHRVPRASVMAKALLPRRALRRPLPVVRRLTIDLREAYSGRPESHVDPAATVLDKYDTQAAYYAGLDTAEIDPDLLDRIARGVRRGQTILVVGSGTGRESFALAEAGWRVVGVEFSPAMIDLARKESERRGLNIEFYAADIRHHEMAAASLGGVFFTYDVYSFLPRQADRIAVLRSMRSWMRPDGRLYLSARRPRRFYDRLVLWLQWLALQRTGDAEWGDSHTRWIATDGTMRRSFVHVFADRELREEIAAGGFRLESWHAGHGTLSPVSPAMIDA